MSVTRELSDPPPAPTPLHPPRRRQSKLLILAGIVLSALCAAGVVWVFQSTDSAVSAVGVASPVRYGEPITEPALREVRVHHDPGVAPVPWEQRFRLIGRIAVTDLLPGEIVTSLVTEGRSGPGPGEQLVGVAVKPAQAPSTVLQPRQAVLMVPSGQPGAGFDTWEPVHGTVLRAGDPDSTGTRIVDVVVAESTGPSLASRASTGNVAIVLLGS